MENAWSTTLKEEIQKGDAATIKAKMEALSKGLLRHIHPRLPERAAEAAGRPAGPAARQQSGQSKQNEDGTIDAEYKIVDEDEKKP